jgi:hypothetical protein
VISGFLMLINFDMSNSRSPKLRQGLGSTVHICPRSNGGRILRLDLTPEIYPPLQRVLCLFLFISDDPHDVGNFGWDPTISDASPPSLHIPFTWKNFDFALIPPKPTLFLFVHRCISLSTKGDKNILCSYTMF